jgi:hypothetical protein
MQNLFAGARLTRLDIVILTSFSRISYAFSSENHNSTFKETTPPPNYNLLTIHNRIPIPSNPILFIEFETP